MYEKSGCLGHCRTIFIRYKQFNDMFFESKVMAKEMKTEFSENFTENQDFR